MKKVLIAIIALSFTHFASSACASLPESERYNKEMEVIRELNQNPEARKWKGGESDVSDLNGCQFLYEQKWIYDEMWKSWSPNQHWFDGKIITGSWVSLNSKHKALPTSLDNKRFHPIYLGPWLSVTLTHKTNFFSFSPTETETKLIRFFAYQNKEGGPITYQYESQTEENKNILEKPFSLSPTAKYPPDNFSLCVVKWTAKYSYNAIAEVKSKNHFSKDYLVPTGRIIDSETGEVIADESRN